MKKLSFIILSEFGELLDLAMYLKFVEKQNVLMRITEKDYSKIGDGIIPKIDEVYDFIGKGYIWIIDGCGHGRLQDILREKGEAVFGGSEIADKLENDRQANQTWFKEAGFQQPFSQNFTSIEEAMVFVQEHSNQRWILKQSGDAPKSLNHMGKFNDSSDMLYHLDELRKGWNEQEFGKVDFDLMEVVEGLECAATAFFNGTDYMRNAEGKVVGYLDFEEKKEADGGVGETTGEMGTTFIGTSEDNKLFKEILIRPKIIDVLRKSKFRGVFNINCIKTKAGLVALEPTCRPGIPATSYEFIEGLTTPTADMIEAVAKGMNTPIEVNQGIGMVMVVAARPYPVEVDLDASATSLGEKLWILKNGKPAKEFSDDQMRHIHLENFEKTDTGYKVATKNGYLLTVTGAGSSIEDTREKLLEYIKDNLYIAGMKYRHDIGKRVEKQIGVIDKNLREKNEIKKTRAQLEKEIEGIKMVKSQVKKMIYG